MFPEAGEEGPKIEADGFFGPTTNMALRDVVSSKKDRGTAISSYKEGDKISNDIAMAITKSAATAAVDPAPASAPASAPAPEADDDLGLGEPDKHGLYSIRPPTYGLKLDPDYDPRTTKKKEKRMKPNIKSSLSLKEAFERFL